MSAEQPEKIRDAALAYAARGVPVFPCNPINKRPLTPNGFKNATTETSSIELWWRTWPNAMVAAPTGQASGFFVLDLDVDAARGVNGDRTLQVLIGSNGSLPATATQSTPRGGRHYFFRYPGRRVKNSASQIGEGLDVRGDGGYIILAPSRNAQGAQYAWDTAEGLDALSAAPDWLLQLVAAPSPSGADRNKSKNAKKHILKELESVSKAAPGQRNEALNRAAFKFGRAVQRGSIKRGDAEQALAEASERCGLVGDDGSESVAATIASGLNAGMAAAQETGGDQRHLAGEEIDLPLPEPWPEPVDGAALLDAIVLQIGRYVVVGTHETRAIALWILHTYCFNVFYITPRLVIWSPVRGCGKTTLVDVLAELTARGMRTSSITPAALFRTVEQLRPTLLIDEADTFVRDDDGLRGILNDGYRRGGKVVRVVGDKHELRQFNTFGPVSIAGLGKLHDTIRSRSIVIELRRKLPTETTDSFRADRTQHLAVLARQCVRWCADYAETLKTSDPELPPGLFNREADNWRPLIALAEAAGKDWPRLAREAALGLMQDADDELSQDVRLLIDTKSVFDTREVDRIASADLCADLAKIEGAPWAEMKNGKAITPNRLARRLKEFRIVPGTIRIGDETPKGYQRHQFDDAFRRYILAEPPQRHNVSATDTPDRSESTTSEQVCRFEPGQKANGSADCGGVATSDPSLDDDQQARAAIVEFDGVPSGNQDVGELTRHGPRKEVQ